MFESIFGAIAVAVFGGLLAAAVGAYRARKTGDEEFDVKKFLTFVPKSLVGAIIALGTSVVAGQVTNFDISSPIAFFGILGIGFGSTFALSGWGKKLEEAKTSTAP